MNGKRGVFTVETVLAAVFFVLFLAMLWVNIACLRFIHWYSLAAFLLPPAACIGVYFFRRKHASGKKARTLVTVLLSVIFVLFTLGNIGLMSTAETFLPNSSASSYERDLKLHGYPGNSFLSHFPAKIPQDARNVRFYEEPSFGPSAFSFVLRYDASADEIESIYNRFTPCAQFVVNKKEFTNPSDFNTVNFDTFFAKHIGYDELPDDFDLVVLDSKSTGTDHFKGYARGLAISRQREQVIYFTVEWH